MKLETFYEPDKDERTIVITYNGLEEPNWDAIRQIVERHNRWELEK